MLYHLDRYLYKWDIILSVYKGIIKQDYKNAINVSNFSDFFVA